MAALAPAGKTSWWADMTVVTLGPGIGVGLKFRICRGQAGGGDADGPGACEDPVRTVGGGLIAFQRGSAPSVPPTTRWPPRPVTGGSGSLRASLQATPRRFDIVRALFADPIVVGEVSDESLHSKRPPLV